MPVVTTMRGSTVKIIRNKFLLCYNLANLVFTCWWFYDYTGHLQSWVVSDKQMYQAPKCFPFLQNFTFFIFSRRFTILLLAFLCSFFISSKALFSLALHFILYSYSYYKTSDLLPLIIDFDFGSGLGKIMRWFCKLLELKQTRDHIFLRLSSLVRNGLPRFIYSTNKEKQDPDGDDHQV